MRSEPDGRALVFMAALVSPLPSGQKNLLYRRAWSVTCPQQFCGHAPPSASGPSPHGGGPKVLRVALHSLGASILGDGGRKALLGFRALPPTLSFRPEGLRREQIAFMPEKQAPTPAAACLLRENA